MSVWLVSVFTICFLPEVASAATPGTPVPQLVVQQGHVATLNNTNQLELSPNEQLLVSIDGKTPVLWHVGSGRELRRFVGHSMQVNEVHFSPNGRYLLSGSDYNTDLRDCNPEEVPTFIDGMQANNEKYMRLLNVGKIAEAEAASEEYWAQQEQQRLHQKKTAIAAADTLKLWDLATGQEVRTFKGLTGSIKSAAFSRDGRMIVARDDMNGVCVWRVTDGKVLTSFERYGLLAAGFGSDDQTVVTVNGQGLIAAFRVTDGRQQSTRQLKAKGTVAIFSVDGKQLAIGAETGHIGIFDISSGRRKSHFRAHQGALVALRFSADGGRLMSTAQAKNDLHIWRIPAGTAQTLPVTQDISAFTLNRQGQLLYVNRYDDLSAAEPAAPVEIWDLRAGKKTSAWQEIMSAGAPTAVGFAGGGGRLEIIGYPSFDTWDLNDGKGRHREHQFLAASLLRRQMILPSGWTSKPVSTYGADGNTLKKLPVENPYSPQIFGRHEQMIVALALSADDQWLASLSTDGVVKIWATTDGREHQTFQLPGTPLGLGLAFSVDGSNIACSYVSFDRCGFSHLALYERNSGRLCWQKQTTVVNELVFAPDGLQLAAASPDGSVALIDARTGDVLHTMAGHGGGITASAYSDDGRFLVTGSLDKSTIIWDPRLGRWLAKLYMFSDGTWAVIAPDGRFDSNNLEEIKGLHWVMPDAPFTPLPLEIFMRDYYEPRLLPKLLAGAPLPPLPNLTDLNRLQPRVEIVKVAASNAASGSVDVTVAIADQSGTVTRDGKEVTLHSGAEDLRLSRDGQLVGWRDGAVALDPQGRATITFAGIALPHRANGAALEFSAYAFNSDRVKSVTARLSHTPPATSTKPQRRAYLVNLGVNAYDNPQWDLRFAANDALRTAHALQTRLQKQGDFAKVVAVELVSAEDPYRRLATRANLQTVLDLLAGRPVDQASVAAIPGADRLQKATPDDLVVISFSGHGYADERGSFYLLTSDIGAAPSTATNAGLLALGVSSDELSTWLRPVDAGELALIIDACHSAASVEGEGFKPGPMGSRGLGQLAYDKGMKILAASQSADVALENAQLQQGLLTYALIQDGLEAKQADFKPQDQQIRIGEWLAYAVERVPNLHEEMKSGKVGSGDGAPRRVVRFAPPGKVEHRELQQPSLFDFRRRGEDALLTPTQ